MGVASKLGKKLTKSKKLQSLEKEYGRKAQSGESAREFQSRMNQDELISEMSGSNKRFGGIKEMFESMTIKQRRSQIREMQADNQSIKKELLDMAGMEKVDGKLKVKPGMMGGGTAMKKKMMMGGGAAMKKKMMMGGGAAMKKKAYAKGGANMKKKSYAAGGASMKKKSYSVGGIVRANAGASVPASGGSRNK